MNEQDTLRALASKYVWWQPPDVTLARGWHFLCQMMTLGTAEDMRTVRRLLGDEAMIDALEHAPPGVMDPKSWNFWHLFFGRPVPPLPVRPLP
jgi:hypothetical protein